MSALSAFAVAEPGMTTNLSAMTPGQALRATLRRGRHHRRMITLHHLENSRSQRVLWLLEELGLPYEIQRYARDRKTSLAPPSLQQVHPLGKSPVISDGAVTVAESGAIIEYLLDTHGGGRLRPPPGTPERRQFTYWLHFAEGSAMPFLVMRLVFDKVASAPVPFFVKPVVKGIAAKVDQAFIGPNVSRQLAFLEAERSRQPWFAGSEFTAADIQMSYPVEAAEARFGLQRQPALREWLDRVRARDAYKRALEAGGPFSVMP